MSIYYDSLPEEIYVMSDKLNEVTAELDKMRDAMKNIFNNSLPPGVKFILMHYTGMLPTTLKSKRSEGGLLHLILGNGNPEDYRKWLGDIESQKRDIRNRKLESGKQPFTYNNVKKVCEIIVLQKLQSSIGPEPFQILDILESEK